MAKHKADWYRIGRIIQKIIKNWDFSPIQRLPFSSRYHRQRPHSRRWALSPQPCWNCLFAVASVACQGTLWLAFCHYVTQLNATESLPPGRMNSKDSMIGNIYGTFCWVTIVKKLHTGRELGNSDQLLLRKIRRLPCRHCHRARSDLIGILAAGT